MSGSKCTICEHKDLPEISQALLHGEPLRSVGERFAVSKSALSRHVREHATKDGLRRTAATLPRPRRRKRGEPIDVGDVLQEIASGLREMLASHTKAMNPSSAAAISQALVRTLEFLEKREAQSDKANDGKGQEKLARVFESWSVPRLLLTLGRCPRGTPLLDACGQMLVCPTHGELGKEEMFAYVRVRAVSDYLESGGS